MPYHVHPNDPAYTTEQDCPACDGARLPGDTDLSHTCPLCEGRGCVDEDTWYENRYYQPEPMPEEYPEPVEVSDIL